MRNLLLLSWMTFVEARRHRVLWSLIFFCLLLLLTSFLVQEVSVATFDRVLRDVGLAALTGFGVILSIVLGVSVVTREIERRTVNTMLTKPIGRGQYLLGKLLGVWLTLTVCLSLMFMIFLLENRLYGGKLDVVLFQCFWLLLVELLVLASFSVFASTFTSSIMSAFMSASLFLMGHLSVDIYFFARRSHFVVFKRLGAALYYVMPNLERLNLKDNASVLQGLPAWNVVVNTAYGLMYAVAFLSLAIASFRRRDLK